MFKMYCIYDRVAMSYTAPVCQVNEGTAKRWFESSMKSTGLRPSDFDLIYLGTYDEKQGNISLADSNSYVMNGGEFE